MICISHKRSNNIDIYFNFAEKCEDDFDSYKQYLGEAFYFRAAIYYDLVRRFGDVLWYDKVLTTNSPELFDARTPRNIVIDHSGICKWCIYETENRTCF